VTTLTTYRRTTPAAPRGIMRFAYSLATTGALLTNSFLFAREMQAAHTPAEQRRVLDAFSI
jgi:hypothetical protein